MKLLLGLVILFIGLFFITQRKLDTTQITPVASPTLAIPTQPVTDFYYPMKRYVDRATYRLYGTVVNGSEPKDLVCGFGFKGIHTGDDLEALDNETALDVPVYAIADATVERVAVANGYGGIVVLKHNNLSSYYGHIDAKNALVKTGQHVKAGQQIAVLGKGCSTETDNERQHLHFSIHSGSNIDIKGYVDTSIQLEAWENPEEFLKSKNAVEPQ